MQRLYLPLVAALLLGPALLTAQTPAVPHLTPETHFMQKKIGNIRNLGDPAEGIFTIQEYNRDLGYASYYGFYGVDGRYLFAPEWMAPSGGETPRFNGGACIAKWGRKNAAGKEPLCILYADASVKELPVTWEEATQFYDGVAKVFMRDGRTEQVFYINTQGEKVWPALAYTYDISVKGSSMSIKEGMHPIREGLRAYFDNKTSRWGYLDDKGNVAIPAKFLGARDFAGGYALVIVKGERDYPAFIDRDGKEVVKPDLQAPTLQYAANLSDVADGMYCIVKDGSNTVYYDMTGKEVQRYNQGAPFFCDYAFVRPASNENVVAVNAKFDAVRRVYPKDVDMIRQGSMLYCPDWGVVTVDEKYVYSADGTMRLQGTGEYGTMVGQFSPEGHAKTLACLFADNKKYEYYGITDLEGNLLVVFSDEEEAGGGWAITPRPKKPMPIDLPPIGGLPPFDPGPQGPKDYQSATYEVCINVYPEGAGTVTGAGKYKYGDKVRLRGSAKQGWVVADVVSDNPSTLYGSGTDYEVRGDGCLTVYFAELETYNFADGVYEGTIPSALFAGMEATNFPVYLEMSPDGSYKSPYGDRTGGVFTFIADPEKTYEGKLRANGQVREGSKVTFNYFPAPMKVLGTYNKDGKKWLVVDGGTNVMANTTIVSTGSGNNSAIEALMMNFTMMFDGFSTVDVAPRHYRIEMKDIDAKTGAFTFGELQTYSTQYGWVPGGDARLAIVERGLFNTKVDCGADANSYMGLRMTPAKQRTDILWYPPESFYDTPSLYQSIVKDLGEKYRNFASNYDVLRNLNITDLR